jgi:hypothetical protein
MISVDDSSTLQQNVHTLNKYLKRFSRALCAYGADTYVRTYSYTRTCVFDLRHRTFQLLAS